VKTAIKIFGNLKSEKAYYFGLDYRVRLNVDVYAGDGREAVLNDSDAGWQLWAWGRMKKDSTGNTAIVSFIQMC